MPPSTTVTLAHTGPNAIFSFQIKLTKGFNTLLYNDIYNY
jgi:hypothetical protein